MDLKGTLKQLTDELAEGVLRYQQAADAQRDVFMRGVSHQPPLLLISGRNKAQERYPLFNQKEIHADSAKMAAYELGRALTAMNGGMGGALRALRHGLAASCRRCLADAAACLRIKALIQAHLPKEQLMDMAESESNHHAGVPPGWRTWSIWRELVKGTGRQGLPIDIQAPMTPRTGTGDAIFYEMYDDPEFGTTLMRLSVAAINIA